MPSGVDRSSSCQDLFPLQIHEQNKWLFVLLIVGVICYTATKSEYIFGNRSETQQKPKNMWEWLWNKAVGRNQKNSKGSVGESPKDLEETNKGSLITLDEAIREGFKEGEEKITGSWNVMEILVMQ